MSVHEKQSSPYLYPRDLAEFVYKHWNSPAHHLVHEELHPEEPDALPPLEVLERIISVCYQASLLEEELRPVTLRIIVSDPQRFDPADGPPLGLQPLVFTEPKIFSPLELRTLSPGAMFHRTLVGVSLDTQNNPAIWGLLQSGPAWLKNLRGGRGFPGYLPPCLTIYVTGPGRIEVNRGLNTVGQLRDGKIFGPSMNIFDSSWFRHSFLEVRSELLALHAAERVIRGQDWVDLNPDIMRIIGQHSLKRIISSVRNLKHGGTLIFVPPELSAELTEKNPYISFKYMFQEGPSRARFRFLMLKIMENLACLGGEMKRKNPEIDRVGWREYATSRDEVFSALDEAIFELSHLVAGLSTVDGAVVLTKRWEVLGFAGEIACGNSDVHTVARALDLEGENVIIESTTGVGTRHRSVYRFCNEHHEAIGVVASQDGYVRICKWKDGRITYWHHHATTASLDF